MKRADLCRHEALQQRTVHCAIQNGNQDPLYRVQEFFPVPSKKSQVSQSSLVQETHRNVFDATNLQELLHTFAAITSESNHHDGVVLARLGKPSDGYICVTHCLDWEHNTIGTYCQRRLASEFVQCKAENQPLKTRRRSAMLSQE